MDITKKTVCRASLIVLFTMAIGFNAMGAQYSVGSGNDDWWTKYPDQSITGKGGEVNHPAWVLDALANKPVVIYVHKGCSYCKPQTEALTKIVDEMGDKFTYYNISADENDVRAGEALIAYDPNGGEMLVPLTVIITLAPNSEGKVEPVWHSTDAVKDGGWSENYVWVKSYIEDALGYYGEKSANWNK